LILRNLIAVSLAGFIFSACDSGMNQYFDSDEITATDKMLGEEKSVTIEIGRIGRTAMKNAVPVPVSYKIDAWRNTVDGWTNLSDTTEDMELNNNKFSKDLTMIYGHEYKIKLYGYDLQGNQVFESPETLFRVDEKNKIVIDLYQTYGVVYALEVLNFNLVKDEDIVENNITKTPFSISPQIVFPFNEMPEEDEFLISLNRVSDGEAVFEDSVQSSDLRESNIFQVNQSASKGYIEHKNIDSNFSDYSSDTFIFSIDSPYSDISSYGTLFTISDGITSGVLKISLLKDYSINQTSSEVKISLYLESIEGLDVALADSNYDWTLTDDGAYSFTFSKNELLSTNSLNFTIEGMITVANRKMLSDYSIIIPDIQVQNSNYMEE
jgi:hypothetical protein